jgi:hypothetical protein
MAVLDLAKIFMDVDSIEPERRCITRDVKAKLCPEGSQKLGGSSNTD